MYGRLRRRRPPGPCPCPRPRPTPCSFAYCLRWRACRVTGLILREASFSGSFSLVAWIRRVPPSLPWRGYGDGVGVMYATCGMSPSTLHQAHHPRVPPSTRVQLEHANYAVHRELRPHNARQSTSSSRRRGGRGRGGHHHDARPPSASSSQRRGGRGCGAHHHDVARHPHRQTSAAEDGEVELIVMTLPAVHIVKSTPPVVHIVNPVPQRTGTWSSSP